MTTSLSAPRLLGACLALGAANALSKPIAALLQNAPDRLEALAAGGGVSWVIWLALAAGLYLLWQAPARPAGSAERRLCLLALFAFLVPNASASWLACAGLALAALALRRGSAAERAGLAILAALALREPLTAALLQLAADPLLRLDAWLVDGLRRLAGEASRLEGNIVSGNGSHRLLILTGCASFSNVSLALLGWFTLSRCGLQPWTPRTWHAGLALVFAVVGLNATRLALMAQDAATYRWLHDGPGPELFGVGLVVATLSLTHWGISDAQAVQRRRRDAGGGTRPVAETRLGRTGRA